MRRVTRTVPGAERPLTVGSLFSGVGGIDLGLERAGMRVLWQSEIDKDASKVLAARWPDAPNLGDITEVDPTQLEHVDLMCGGFPCQDVSVAGKRAGLAGARTGLFFDFVRLLKVVQPEWIILENVPGLLSSNKGEDFRVVLDVLADSGYQDLAWRVVDSLGLVVPGRRGVPQRRRRLYIVGRARVGASAAALLLEPEGRPWSPPARDAQGQDAAAAAGRGAARGGRSRGGVAGGIRRVARAVAGVQEREHVGVDVFNLKVTGEVAATLDTTGAKAQSGPSVLVHPAAASSKTSDVQERAPIAQHTFQETGHEQWSDNDFATTLTHHDAKDNHNVVATGVVFQPNGSATEQGDHSAALTASMAKAEGNSRPHVVVEGAPAWGGQIIPFRKAGRARSKDDVESWTDGEHSNCLNVFDDAGEVRATHLITTFNVQPVSTQIERNALTAKESAHAEALTAMGPIRRSDRGDMVVESVAVQDVRGLDKKQNGKGWNDEGAAYTVDTVASQGVALGVPTTARVRRLTPLECVRLQGFPDDWLEGLGLSDSAKYRAMGNAVTVNAAEWLGRAILGVLRDEAAMGRRYSEDDLRRDDDPSTVRSPSGVQEREEQV